MEQILRESRHAARRLARTPGFTAAVILTLALAIGANTATFTLLHRVVLSPLPYPAADRLIALDHAAPGVGLPAGVGMSMGLYREYASLPSVERIGIYSRGETTLSGDGDAERLQTLESTPSMGELLGAAPALGRWFTEEDGTVGAPRVAVLTHALWERRFGSNAAVLGTSIMLDGIPHDVIGVMPRDFVFPDDRSQIIRPLQLNLANAGPAGFNFAGMARLRPGVSVSDARRQQDAVIADLPARFPAHGMVAESMIGDAQFSSLALPLRDDVLGDTARTLWVLLGSVTIVLLIACANLANLFLVRTDARRREVAVRRALGADAGGVAGFFLTETMLVALASGVLGLLLGYIAVEVLVSTRAIALPRLHEVRVDGVVVGFALLASIIAGTAFGLMPLVRRLPAVASVLQDSGRGNTASGSRMRARHALMTVQVSLAVVLLIAAGLMVQSFVKLQNVDAGFTAGNQLVFRLGLPWSTYDSEERAAQFQEQLLERVRALPGVRGAAFTTMLPLDGSGWGDPLDVHGRLLGPGQIPPIVQFRRVSTDYFPELSIPLRQGRHFDRGDESGVTNAAIIDQATADIYFPGEDPIGRQMRPWGGDDSVQWFTVVGVVGNTATTGLREAAPMGKLYLPIRSVTTDGVPSTHRVTFVIGTAGSPIAFVPAIRRVLDELDPQVAIARPERITDVIERAQATHAFTMILLVLASAVALLLGIIGVYAVISYSVAQRRGEIGVRIALGAQTADVTGMIVRQSGAVIALGVVLGVAGAIAATRLMDALLFGIAPDDPVTYAAAALGLFLTAMIACWVPAWRAARLDPLASLRGD